MRNTTTFRAYQPDQQLIFPPAIRNWLPEDHLVFFVTEVVQQLDLTEIYESYDGRKGGKPWSGTFRVRIPSADRPRRRFVCKHSYYRTLILKNGIEVKNLTTQTPPLASR